MSSRSDPARGTARSVAARLLDGALVLSASLGVLVGVWWALTCLLGVGLVTFETGSMSPVYDAGAIAVSAPIRLSSVRPGDVVTVDRGRDELPITHRVVSIGPVDGGAVLRLKGDANRQPDPEVYRVHAVRLVVGAVPTVLLPLTWLARPAGALAAVLLAAVAVLRAFWPNSARPSQVPGHGRRRASSVGALVLRR